MRTAVVVGAGVGGLAAAGALGRSGWRVTLIERGDRLRGRGAALFMWPNGLAALESLGLSLGDATFPIVMGGIQRPDGRWLTESAQASGDAVASGGAVPQPVVVHAEDLHDALMAGLSDQVEIRTNVEITMVRAGLAERPSVSTSKHTFSADLIVAADGGRSQVRRLLAPQACLVAAGYTAWRAVVPWFRAPKLPDAVPAAGQMLGAGHRFLHASLGNRGNAGASARGGIYWVATAPGAPRPESPQIQLNLLRRWFADWGSPVPELLDATEPRDLVQQAGEELRPLPGRFGFPVGAGGFVLLGDAAHVATPNLTQGACLALEDAVILRAAVRDAQPGLALTQAVEAYSQVRRPRVARVAKASRRLGLVLQAQGRLAVRARDAALGRMPAGLLDRASTVAHDWTPPA
jgi:2-polyprenyl-6-methoxyphenol hydroxylase-like FAD-dependent oxidoreductase